MLARFNKANLINHRAGFASVEIDYSGQSRAARLITQPLKRSDQIIIARNTLVVLCGPAGCGKSSFAARHFRATQVVSSDDCRAIVSDDAANQGVSGHAFELMQFIIKKRLMLSRLTVADATHLNSEDRKRLINTARQFGFNVVAIIFDVPLDICLARNAARSRVVPVDALKNQHTMLELTMRAIEREGFDDVFILDEEAQARATIKIAPPINRPLPERES